MFILLFVITILFILVNHIEENFVNSYRNSESYVNKAKEQTSPPTGTIVGIVVGVVFIVACIGDILYITYRRRTL